MQNYNELHELIINDFGQAKYAQIMFKANQMLVNAYGLAGAIALLGAFFGVYLSHWLVKEVRQGYNKYLVNQKQLAITMKQSKATKEAGNLDFKQLLAEFEGVKKFYEIRGLFTTDFERDPELIKK